MTTEMEKLILISLAIAIVSGLYARHKYSEQQILKKGLPPGFALECNGEGKYRAVYINNGAILVDFIAFRETKINAIRRAWRQVDYDNKVNNNIYKINTNNWSRCD